MELPEREKVRRYDPVTPQQWSQYMDSEGRIQHVDHLKDDIFRGVQLFHKTNFRFNRQYSSNVYF